MIKIMTVWGEILVSRFQKNALIYFPTRNEYTWHEYFPSEVLLYFVPTIVCYLLSFTQLLSFETEMMQQPNNTEQINKKSGHSAVKGRHDSAGIMLLGRLHAVSMSGHLQTLNRIEATRSPLWKIMIHDVLGAVRTETSVAQVWQLQYCDISDFYLNVK